MAKASVKHKKGRKEDYFKYGLISFIVTIIAASAVFYYVDQPREAVITSSIIINETDLPSNWDMYASSDILEGISANGYVEGSYRHARKNNTRNTVAVSEWVYLFENNESARSFYISSVSQQEPGFSRAETDVSQLNATCFATENLQIFRESYRITCYKNNLVFDIRSISDEGYAESLSLFFAKKTIRRI